jgi:hypothetical protein
VAVCEVKRAGGGFWGKKAGQKFSSPGVICVRNECYALQITAKIHGEPQA